jgi:hypothetical protein
MPVVSQAAAAWGGQPNAAGAGALAAALLRKPAGLPEPGAEPGAATASVVIDPTADTSVEADETVSLMLALGTGYSIGTTTAVTGTISNDDLIAPPLVFTSQADLLTGTSGADRFVLNRLSDALWSSTPDRITNLQAGVDSIDSPHSRTTAIKPKQLGMVQTLDIASI